MPVESSEPVDPRMPEMRFTFSRSMDVSRIGLGAENGAVFPRDRREAPHFLDDGRTFVVSVFLQPQTRYVMVLKGAERRLQRSRRPAGRDLPARLRDRPRAGRCGSAARRGAAGAAVDLDPGNDAGDEGEATSQ
ncbi:MAG: hypothetical protein R3D33_18525 [Hyphomicrobiaceae bacterium]